jgi:lysophospholipase L1-like esterase
LVVAVAVAALTLVPAAGASAAERPHRSALGPVYYLSLGDSLAQGVQPDRSGTSLPTDQGYADDLYAWYHRTNPRLQLVKLGCPGETTTTMLKGGICAYGPGDQMGNQLDAAVHFLQEHRGHIALVTLDIGANNVDGCLNASGIDQSCVATGIQTAKEDLWTILRRLRSAAGPSTRIVGMNYYDPFLAAWLQGTAGQQTATASVQLTEYFNGVLAADYAHFHVPVANVAAEYRTDNFRVVPLVNEPVNVLTVCALTWMCAPAPVGPNIHANAWGYWVIADAFTDVIGPRLSAARA